MPDAYSRVWEDFTDDLDAENMNDLEGRMEARVAGSLGPLSALVPETNFYPYYASSVLAGKLPIATDPTTEGYTGGPGNGVWGYNPSYEAHPGNSHLWFNMDAVIKVDAGTGNRAYFRSAQLTNIQDPSELVFLRAEGADGTSPNGYGPNDDGTDIVGLPQGATIGFVVWYGACASGSDPSFQGDSGRIGVNVSEDVRQDFPQVLTSGSVTLPQATITTASSMDATLGDDGASVPFEQNGSVTIGTQTVRYAARTATKLLGCSGGTGTFASGTQVRQRQNRTGARMSFKNSTIGSTDSQERFRLQGDGGIRLGARAMNTNSPTWFNIAGGPGRYEKLPDPSALTATVVGTAGTVHYSYYVVGHDPYDGVTNDLSVTCTTGPATLTTTNYIKLAWTCPAGIDSFDVVRSASDGSPGSTGPIILGQRVYEGASDGAGGGSRYGLSACDTGLSVSGTNEVQTIKLLNTDGGTFTLTFHGDTTTNIAYNASAATIQAALVALPGIGSSPDDVSVVDSSFLGWQITFQNTLAATNVNQITTDTSLLTNSGTETPGVQQRTRVEGAPSTYTPPGRNTTGDFQFDGAVGFYGTSPIDRPGVSGSRTSGTALFNLLAALEDLGLIHDNTTA